LHAAGVPRDPGGAIPNAEWGFQQTPGKKGPSLGVKDVVESLRAKGGEGLVGGGVEAAQPRKGTVFFPFPPPINRGLDITLLTFGYDGWGNHTPELIKAVNAIERSRGFKPPIFVDIRIRRTVRAKGFQGNAFGELLGKSRHHWMKSLGNERIVKKTGPRIQI